MKAKTFYKTRLATSISVLLGASVLAPAVAQEVSDSDVEVINVTGIRGSMLKSLDVKRSSTGIVDAINAEDIGKFPDTNLAESLQRISGVAIDRNNGEGSQVTVRGFGPTRNLVTLNGRQLPTTTGERSFDFANLAAESVSGVEVYKTSQAHVPTGGIGATINITTLRPLSNPGMHATISAQALDDTSTQSGSVTPELSGLYSNTSDDGKFGVAISASYSERESGSQKASVGTGWRSFPGIADNDWSGSNAAWGGVAKDDTQTNRPGDDDIYSVPQTTIYQFEEQQRTRTNAQLVLQYSPVEEFTATVDYTYVNRDVDTQWNNVSAWYGFGASENVWSDGPIASPLLYSETYATPTDLSMGASDAGTRDRTDSIGVNLDWQVNDSLNLELDYHNSEAKNTPNNPLGSSNQLAMAGFVRTSAATDFTGDYPVLAVGGGNAIQPSDMIVTGSVFTNVRNQAEIEQTQLRGEYVFDNGGSIDFGVSLTDASNHSQEVNVQRNNWGGEGTAGQFDDALFPRETIHDKFDDVDGGNFNDFGPENYDILNTYFAFDFEGIRSAAEALFTPASFADGTLVGDCGSLFCPSSDYAAATDQLTEEEMTAVYLQYNYQGEIGDMPYDVHVGLRYEETDITATSAVPEYNGARWEGTTEVTLLASGIQEFQTRTGSYTHTLPSINFNIEVVEDVMLRAAYSETIGRPSYGDMIGGQTLNQGARITGGTGNTGDPGLKPLESTNIDLSAEWYYAEGSYASVGYFTKDVTNFISTAPISTTFDIVNPADGPYQSEALAAVGNDGLAQREYIFETYGATDPNVFKDDSGNIIIIGNPATDAAMTFDIFTPVNDSEERTFDGWEFTLQHLFGDTGFGLFTNYTLVNTENEYDNFVIGDQIAEQGISDTANFVAFYEANGFSARIAYNWRDKFYVSGFQGDVGPAPVYTEEYSQVDFNIGYDIPQIKGLNVFIQGINITNEYTRNSGRTEIDVLDVTQTGARYSIGARYTF
ncbi:TonB-dependent receptor [Paraglaciecola chathamensis]|jgi:TonB-dependent receptor|uniref:TonB-dependent receptor n=2 Tax=Paraglaciecola chathamensis TaxID=368405 RepID=A0ABS0WFJ6_9ALTE|nr:TonB-dependent receptor [Paraglaciecola chathamensis]MBJ2137257.1 TonB-dependent receptor [Paraglaciecola chathamensis]GAC08741.1 TonB-dependent receptor plug [Paraglaciecola chathamensis S18K6]